MHNSDLTQLLYSHRLHLQMMRSCLKDHRIWLKHPELDYLQKSRQYAQAHLDLAKSCLDKFLSDASNIGVIEIGVNGVFVS